MNNKDKFTELRKLEKEKLKKEREGKDFFNKYNEKLTIIEYNGYHDVKIRFSNGYEKQVNWNEVVNKSCLNPYSPTVCNIGYLGEGKYNPQNHQKIYKIWKSMIERCYKNYLKGKNPTYEDCYVENYLLNFQNYAKWYEEKEYKCNNEEMAIDKDILEKGNKCYDREHMIFVPRKINNLFNKRQNRRGEYPIGVHKVNPTSKNYRKEPCLQSQCNIIDKNGKTKKVHLGYFPLDKPFQAFYTYKLFKENYIKQVADEYKDLIPKELYEAMYRYEVEIND